MRTIGKWLGRILLTLFVAMAGLWFLGPREPVGAATFDPASIGDDVDIYLANAEAEVPNLKAGQQKQVIWAGEPGEKTEFSVVYIHGYGASLQEIRPVPDMVANDLTANLVFTRLRGHGRDSIAMGEPTVADWLNDTKEALAVARKIGDKILIISTSTGGTLVATALTDAGMAENVVGSVFVSPNFKVANPAAVLLTWPLARHWGPFVAGETRSWKPHNALQGQYWTTSTPMVAALPMAAIVKHASGLDYSAVKIPALFVFSDEDTVVRHDATRLIVDSWGGPTKMVVQDLPAGSDPSNHVIAGDILSPAMNAPTSQLIIDWFGAL